MKKYTYVENFFGVRLTRWRYEREDGTSFWRREDETFWDNDPRNPSSKEVALLARELEEVKENIRS